MNIKKIKTDLERTKKNLLDYIDTVGSISQVEIWSGINRGQLSKYIKRKKM